MPLHADAKADATSSKHQRDHYLEAMAIAMAKLIQSTATRAETAPPLHQHCVTLLYAMPPACRSCCGCCCWIPLLCSRQRCPISFTVRTPHQCRCTVRVIRRGVSMPAVKFVCSVQASIVGFTVFRTFTDDWKAYHCAHTSELCRSAVA